MIRKLLVVLALTTAMAAGAADAQETQADQRGEAKGGSVSDDQKPVSAAELLGTAVMGANQEQVGKVSDVLLGPNEQKIMAYVVDIGGFLGLNARRVTFAADGLEIYKDDIGTLHIYSSATDEMLNTVPDYDEQVFRVNPESLLVKQGPGETGETTKD